MIGPWLRPLPENAHHGNRDARMLPAGFEPAVPANERLQTLAQPQRSAVCVTYDSKISTALTNWSFKWRVMRLL
jgi:hypothetical protein